MRGIAFILSDDNAADDDDDGYLVVMQFNSGNCNIDIYFLFLPQPTNLINDMESIYILRAYFDIYLFVSFAFFVEKKKLNKYLLSSDLIPWNLSTITCSLNCK